MEFLQTPTPGVDNNFPCKEERQKQQKKTRSKKTGSSCLVGFVNKCRGTLFQTKTLSQSLSA
jgi:hypothetical protein